MICIAIISDPDRISGVLTKWFTGSPAYHIGFVDLERGKFYDMNLLFRRREWPHYDPDKFKLYKCPVQITSADLEWWLDNDDDWYGVADYCSFLFKRFYHGTERPSYKGAICSEKVEQILRRYGWTHAFAFTPAPADFEKVLEPL